MAETAYDRYRKILSNPSSRLGLPSSSRLGSALDSVGSFVSDQAPVVAEAMRFGDPFSAPHRIAKFLSEPRTAAPASRPSGSMAQPAASTQRLDFDSVPGSDEHGVTDFIRRPEPQFQEFAPGVKFKDGGSGSGDAQAIEGLRGRSGASIRPLLAARGDGGGPLSGADMEVNQAAMDTVDDYFTNAPQEQRLQELGRQAKEREFDSTIADPLWRQRGQAEINMGQQFGLKTFESQLQQSREQERRQAYGAEIEEITNAQLERQGQIDGMPPGPEKDDAQGKLDTMVQAAKQTAQEKFGLGAGINSAFVDRK